MKHILNISGPAGIVVAVLALIPVLVAVSLPARAQQTCIADWSEAGPIVRREGLASIESVGRLARDRAAVEIVTSALCRADDRYVYRLTVRGGQGSLRTLVVDARKPFEP